MCSKPVSWSYYFSNSLCEYLFKVLKFSSYSGKANSVFGYKIQRPATVQVPEQNQDIKTIHIPKTMTAAPFLQVFHENVLNPCVLILKSDSQVLRGQMSM